MIKIILSAVFFCFLAVTVPISHGKHECWAPEVGLGLRVVGGGCTSEWFPGDTPN